MRIRIGNVYYGVTLYLFGQSRTTIFKVYFYYKEVSIWIGIANIIKLHIQLPLTITRFIDKD